MIYYLKKTLTHKNSKRVLIIEKDDIASIPANSILVLVDDFAGTGKSIEDFYNNISPRLPSIHSKYALTVAFLERAEKKLAALDIVTIGNKRLPAFSARGSVFGYPPRMKALREFCFKYGNMLFPEESYKLKHSHIHPLGFLNTQGLIGFEHSIPNNTLPIIWADKMPTGNWIPLFPRSGKGWIERSMAFKRNQFYWMAQMFKLGLNKRIFSLDEQYSTETIKLVSLLQLKKIKVGSINSIFYFLHKAAEPFNCLEQDNLA